MKVIFPAILLLVLSFPIQAKEARLLAASATSSAPGAADVTCLLDDHCQGEWTPDSRDEGIDEGLYFQFDEEIDLESIEMIVQKSTNGYDYKFPLYVNGKTSSPDGRTFNLEAQSGKKPDDRLFKANVATKARSIFIKIGKPYRSGGGKQRVKSIKLFKRVMSNVPGEYTQEQIKLALPVVAKSKVSATSVLVPETAYQPANMFDSRYDFAWSTNGKLNDGVGESFELELSSPLSLSGLLVWNGYQRSATHFKKNGRVKHIQITTDSGKKQTISLADVQGVQKVAFKEKLNNVKKLRFKIEGVYAGTRYKDVLISELRLLGTDGKIVHPEVKASKVAIPKGIKDFVGRSWSSFLHGVILEDKYDCNEKCFNTRIRMRENGSFVIYRDFAYGASNDGSVQANIMEGNWVNEQKGRIRIFGKRYTSELKSSDYMNNKSGGTVSAKIFQSYLTIKRFSDLSAKEKKGLYQYLSKNRGMPKTNGEKLRWDNLHNSEDSKISGNKKSEMLKSLEEYLTRANPYYIKSSVLTDLLLPTANVYVCSVGC